MDAMRCPHMTCRLLLVALRPCSPPPMPLPNGPAEAEVPAEADGERPKIGVVFGEVQDLQSGVPIEFATISLLAFDEDKVITGGVTDSKGRFRITEIPLGRFRAQIGFMGYTSATVDDIRLTRAAASNRTSAPSASNPTSRRSRPPRSSSSAPPSR